MRDTRSFVYEWFRYEGTLPAREYTCPEPRLRNSGNDHNECAGRARFYRSFVLQRIPSFTVQATQSLIRRLLDSSNNLPTL